MNGTMRNEGAKAVPDRVEFRPATFQFLILDALLLGTGAFCIGVALDLIPSPAFKANDSLLWIAGILLLAGGLYALKKVFALSPLVLTPEGLSCRNILYPWSSIRGYSTAVLGHGTSIFLYVAPSADPQTPDRPLVPINIRAGLLTGSTTEILSAIRAYSLHIRGKALPNLDLSTDPANPNRHS